MNSRRWLFKAKVGMVFCLVLLGCGGDDVSPNNKYVNSWVFEQMKLYYLWEDDLPNSPNKSLEPDDFFETLLSDEDRFSWIQDNYQELLNSLNGINKEAGYEFKLYLESQTSDNVIAQVMYVKPGSPASTKDLLRGDVITHINGQQMTISNYQSMLSLLGENHTIKYKRYDGSGVLTDKGSLSLTAVQFAENPNFMHTILDYPDQNKKIGYYVYNFFSPGSNNVYNTQMSEVFSDFKNGDITDLVVDLRFNSGGAESATIWLASLIGKNVTSSDVFVRREFNQDYGDFLVSTYGPDILIPKFKSLPENIGNQISGKVYVLTGSRTASASELLINGLKPYMNQVFIIGDTTIGKNVGSISLFKQNDPKNTWGMQPIVTKSYNSQNNSDYGDGFIPDIPNDDNKLRISPLGDPEEELLSIAIAEITGVGGRVGKGSEGKSYSKSIGSSLDRKRGKFNLLIDDERMIKMDSQQIP